MNVQTRPCDARRIADFLDGRLSEPEQAVLEEHLSTCEACRASLGAQTADDELWDKASRYLRDEDEEFESPPGAGDSAAECDQTYSIQHVLDALGPTDDPAMLGRLGAYEISGVVGSGGMGVVLKALDRSLDRTVAIKVMAPHLATNGAARKRFAREAKAAAAVLHPNVMAIHSVSSGDSLPFLVMPYLRGTSLQKRLDAEGPLPVGEILRIAAQTAAGLAAAHAQGLIHRDIKPANILLEEGVERVAITDFGLARAVDDASMTRTGVVAGTPQYMSPEQARGEPLGQSSDLFSLGSVLYAMCTGRPPFRAESSYGVLRRITDDEPKSIREINPDIPEWLCAIIAKLMAKQPDQRFHSASEVADLLEVCLAHVQQPTTVPLPESIATPSANQRRRPPLVRLLMAAVFAFALIFAGILIVLELNKGQLTIESEADDVPIRILQGDEVVEKLTVSQSGKTVRIAAGRYQVEVEGNIDGISVAAGTVTLKRRGQETVKIVRSEGRDSQPSAIQQERTTPANVVDDSLEGVWQQVLPPATKDPEDQRFRLVFVDGWFATFQGSERISASRIKVEPQHTPKRISNVDLGLGWTITHGIYEVNEDRLRLRIAPDTADLQTDFGSKNFEFERATGKLAEEQLAALKQYAKKAATTDASRTTQPNDVGSAKHPSIESRSAVAAARNALLASQRDKHKHPPLEFRIAVSKADRDADGVAWFPIMEQRISALAGESGNNVPIDEKLDEKWRGLLWGKTEHTLLADGTWRVVKCEVAQSAQSTDLAPSFEIRITLDAVGGALLRRLTSTHLNQSLAIVVEGTIVAAPVLRSEFGEDFVITGNFSKTAADKLAAAIRKPDPRKRAFLGLRFADAKTALAALKDEAAQRKLRGFEATLFPRSNSIDITAADADTLEALQEILGRLETSAKPLWRKYGVTPAPVSELTAKVLESIGLHLRPITKDDFREKNVFAKYAGGLDVTFVRSDNGTAGKAGIHEADIVVKLQGRLMLSLADLDAAMQNAAEQIKRKDADSLQFDVLRSGETVRVNVPFPDLGVAMLRKDATEQIVTSFVLRFANSKSALATMKDEAASRKIHGFEATIDARRNSILIISDTVTLKALQEILERLDTKEGPDGDSNNTSPDRSTRQPSETRKTEKTEGIEDATPGIRVKLRLNGDRHSREMLQKNIGFDQLSLMGTGVKSTLDGKEVDNLVVVLAHGCRLESLEETENGGTKYWNATLFVQQGPTNDGSNLGLSQKRLDQMQEQGVQFWLDHLRDMSSRIAVSKTGTLADAVATFNAKAKLNQIGKDQPALTEDEVVAAIRGWIREMVPASDEVYDAFQKIAESRRLPERAELSFTTHAHGYRGFDSDVWWVDLVIFTDEETGYGFRIRDQKIRSRPSIEHEGVAKPRRSIR